MKRALIAALQVLALFPLFFLGFGFALLPYLPEVRMHLAHRLIHQPDIFLFTGIGLIAIAVVLGLAFFGLQRGRYLRIRMGTDIEVGLLRRVLEECFKSHFPQQIALEGIELDGGTKLEIAVRLAPTTERDREILFRSAEEQLKQLLRKKFSYTNPFYLTVRIP